MSVRRFLSRRDKSPGLRHRHDHDKDNDKDTKASRKPTHFDGVFVYPNRDPEKNDKDYEKKIKGILERLRYYGINNINEANIEYALELPSSHRDPEIAFRFLMMLEDTYEGIIHPYNVDTKMLGAINKQGITCYLDTLLFAMFAKLDSFEAMLYDNFEDAKRKRLAGLLRLWVNMLRTGRLVTTDLTGHIQQALVACGWREAGEHQQQDPSEAFGFITRTLELPMLTLKMDMFHYGKPDPKDDHKFVNERLLEVAILDEPPEGHDVITLEDCLEHYFNNKVEVKRYQEEVRRRNTLKSASLTDGPTKVEKESGTHVEVVELAGPETPIAASPAVQTPVAEVATPSFTSPQTQNLRPTLGRKRQDSIFSQRKVEIVGVDPEAPTNTVTDDSTSSQVNKLRKMSTRTEVLMPAWQFFKLLPWYTDNMPTSDAQVAAHFSKKRPVLGICLKRYSYTNTGQARRLDTFVDIPTEIAVPNFVGDDSMQEEGPLMGNFRLVLQSVVCHRGTSVHSGHYVCLCRGRPKAKHLNTNERSDSLESDDRDDPWMLFDDLHREERVREVDVREALKREMPYLLFYQVLPIGEEDDSVDLPSYTEATSRSQSDAAPMEKPLTTHSTDSEQALSHTTSAPQHHDQAPVPDAVRQTSSARPSLDAGSVLDISEIPRRKSITIDTSSNAGSIRTDRTGGTSNSNPPTPSDEKNTSNLLSVASKIGSRRGSRQSRVSGTSTSRPTSTGPSGERESSGRFSLNMSKLTQRISRSGAEEAPVIQPSEHVAAELAGQKDAKDASSSERPSSRSSGAGTGTGTGVVGVKSAVKSTATMPPNPNPNPSRESVTLPRSGGSGGRLRKEKAGKKKGRKGEEDDRDCVVQ